MQTLSLAHKVALSLASISVAGTVYLARTPNADACGCFAPPDPSVPIVQAGERIAFAMEDGIVTSHIQIQYSGDAQEFAWLLPLPSLPEMELGTDELFSQLIGTTQPKYRLNREYVGNCPFDPSRGGFPGDASSEDSDGGAPPAEPGGGSPLVVRDTVGPYDYAVLRADSKQPMLDWLVQERFFVPAGTDQAVDAYIRPGAYFLALKLRKGESTGDLQPVVVRYRSDLPMIPIVLTSVAADPDMGVLVWVIGHSRAIPRNYFHTLINDALIDWSNSGANYVDVITRAVDEADGHHSFVTEYAGTSAIMTDLLDYPGRFGSLTDLAQTADAISYIEYLMNYGYATFSNQPPFFGPQFSSQIISILSRYLPIPSALAEQGITPNEYYVNIAWYLGTYREQNPDLFLDLDIDYDPMLLTGELEERVVQPTLDAGRMFRDNPYMTRMFTTLSPDEMNQDPVFSFNPDLADVSNIHEATMTYYCGIFGTTAPQSDVPARLVTEQGWELSLPNGEGRNEWLSLSMPASLAIQILREEGQPEVVADNGSLIGDLIDDHHGVDSDGCAVTTGRSAGGLSGVLLLTLLGIAIVRRRR